METAVEDPPAVEAQPDVPPPEPSPEPTYPAPQDQVPAHEDPAYDGIRVYYSSGMFVDYRERFLELESKVQEMSAYGGVLLKMQNVETDTIELVNLQLAERLQPVKLQTAVGA